MTQASIFDAPESAPVAPQGKTRRKTRTSRTDRLAEYFKRHPNTWLHSDELASVAGKCGWRTRVSNCRTQHGMTIENKLERIRTVDRAGEAGEFVTSFYRFIPARQE